MKITNLKNVSKDRIFRNKKALKRLLKNKGYFVRFDSDYCFSGILAMSKKRALYVNYAEFNGDYGTEQTVRAIKIDNNKTFIVS